MVRLEQSSDHGVLQDFVEYLFRSDMIHSRLDIVVEAESFGLNSDLMEIVGFCLLVPMIVTVFADNSIPHFPLMGGVIITERFTECT